MSINGYETDQEVEQSKFCYEQITTIVRYNESGATVEFTIKNTLTFQELLEIRPVKELPEFWPDFYLYSLKDDDYSLIELGKYFQLSVTAAQGDIGLSCILTKLDNKFYICKMYHWSFHEDFTFGGKYFLPEIIRVKVFN